MLSVCLVDGSVLYGSHVLAYVITILVSADFARLLTLNLFFCSCK